MSVNNNKGTEESQQNLLEIVPQMAKVHPSLIGTIIKSGLVFISFLAVGYYTLWMSSNYVRKDNFDAYIAKQDQILNSRFDLIQNRLENILNQQIITTEQFKNLNIILSSQQKSLDVFNDRLTFLERNFFQNSKENKNQN